jgi:AmpE protein
MSFLALVTALLLLRFWSGVDALHRDGWFRSWQDALAGLPLPGALQFTLAIVGPALLIQGFTDWLLPGVMGLQWIVVSAAVLLYSFGRGDYHEQVARYGAYCEAGDFEGAYLYFSGRYHFAPAEELDAQAMRSAVQRHLLYEGFQRVFPPLLYFVLLGPAGALAYRLLQLSRQGPWGQLGDSVLRWADWLPARLFAGIFTLTGDFVRSREQALTAVLELNAQAAPLLQRVARAAVGIAADADDQFAEDPQAFNEWAAQINIELDDLLGRSVLAAVGLLALWVLLA